MVIRAAGSDNDFVDTLKKYYGKRGYIMGLIVFIYGFFVALIV